jgi:hypothetical protein
MPTLAGYRGGIARPAAGGEETALVGGRALRSRPMSQEAFLRGRSIKEKHACQSENREQPPYVTDNPNSCAGWEVDPQSFTIQLAKHYLRTMHPHPKDVNSRVSEVVPGKYGPKTHVAIFESGDEVHVSMIYIPGGPAVASRGHGTPHCYYSYTCTPGVIKFSLIRCSPPLWGGLPTDRMP